MCSSVAGNVMGAWREKRAVKGPTLRRIGEAVCQKRRAPWLALPEDMDMRRLMIIDVDDHGQTVGTQHSAHSPKQPIQMGYSRQLRCLGPR
jgi:hypothetical protein